MWNRLGKVALVAVLSSSAACATKRADVTKELPALTFKDDAPDLLLTWLDDKGDSHMEMHPADVPEAGRKFVRVVVSDREEGTHDLLYVADLSRKSADGTYSAHTVPRGEWEAEIDHRRAGAIAEARAGAAAKASAASEAATAPPIVIYGASWCGACHQAADYLKSKGVRYVMKDVETTPGAESEMSEKLARIGRHGGSIPVIDVAGQILVGFSPGSLDQALAKAKSARL